MSYAGIATLGRDPIFQDRVNACATIECQDRLDEPNQPDEQNLSYDVLRYAPHVMDAFVRITAQTPAIINKAEVSGKVDQTRLTDTDIQTAVRAAFPVVTSMWYNPDGTPWGGAMVIPSPAAVGAGVFPQAESIPDTVPETL